MSGVARGFLVKMRKGLGGDREGAMRIGFAGEGALPSVFAVQDFAAAAIGVAGLAISDLLRAGGFTPRQVAVDCRLASLWFGWSIRPVGWELPPAWDPVAGDYEARDGWIRLHTNAPRHREAALSVLGVPADKKQVASAVARWEASALQDAVVGAGGCAAAMHSIGQWRGHPQGAAVMAEPLCHMEAASRSASRWRPGISRPLAGLRVLDLTRVLAGPVATRFLAGFGAEVLRIDPPDWEEPAVVPDVTLGKHCARLDLHVREDRETFGRLLQEADVIVHGYRADALESLGFGADRRRALNPALIDVALNAYGWTGPWRGRRGFDSLVQMSAGIASEGMRRLERPRPTPLPVQALDHATGYLMAAAVIAGLTRRMETSRGCMARLSLARTAAELAEGPRCNAEGVAVAAGQADWSARLEATGFGPARRLRGPVVIGDTEMAWNLPATRLGSSPAAWSS